MNENINLTKILKDCPKGWNLYTPIYGKVEFSSVKEDDDYPIVVSFQRERGGSRLNRFTKEGYFFTKNDAECLLLPSKEQRDWSKFSAAWYKKKKFDPKTLKPFDKVLGGSIDSIWKADFFSHERGCKVFPYNDDTKHLVGTKEKAPEYYRYWED